MTLCCKSAEFPTQPKDATLALGPAFYCGAVRIAPDMAITARHCITDGLCGTATDIHGVSVQCEVAALSETADVGTINLAPGTYAEISQLGEYKDGVQLECVSHRPFPFTRRTMTAVRETTPPCIGTICLPNTIRLDGYVVQGESGSGCWQGDKLVAVISVTDLNHKRAWATLVLN